MSEAFLNRKEFESLSEDFKWEYVDGLIKSMKKLRLKADKNCEECESEMLAVDDINIDLLFEDWRDCAENCGTCGKELVHSSIKTDDGETVHVSECPDGHGKIKSPMCCGQDMEAK